jgi:hypothetical protein
MDRGYKIFIDPIRDDNIINLYKYFNKKNLKLLVKYTDRC